MGRLTHISLIASLALLCWQNSFAADSQLSEEVLEMSVVAASIELEQRRLQLTDQIDSLQSEYGPYDYRLLEALQGLSTFLIEAENFVEAGKVLNRQLQLLRTVEGPANLQQLPLVAEAISNDIRVQNWQSVTDRFEFLQWLQGQNSKLDISARINAMSDASAWHLAAVYFDSPQNRVRHFMSSREIQQDILRLAENEYGEESEDLIPWLYAAAVELYRVVAFLKSEDELGYAAKQRIASMEGRSQRSYLLEAYGIIKRIHKIIDAGDNLEAQAMAMIYVADFQMLRGLGIASKMYRSAGEKLAQAGVEQQQIDAFFARPVVLPVHKYHLSIDQALEQQTAQGYNIKQGTEGVDELVHMGDFIAWNESLPYARRPEMPDLAAGAIEELSTAQVRFSLNSRGKTLNAKAREAAPDTVRVRRDARDAIEDMQFRPRFVQGRWKRVVNVSIRYLYPEAK